MKKAALGFKYIALDGELLVPTEKDVSDSRLDRLTDSHTKEKQRKLRCYNKNKLAYNRQKRAVARSIVGRYEEAKRNALKYGQEWRFDLETWERAWQTAGWVTIPGSQSAENPEGVTVPAFGLRGPHRYNNTCMVRIDFGQPWSPDNTKIVFRGEELAVGSRWYKNGPTTEGQTS